MACKPVALPGRMTLTDSGFGDFTSGSNRIAAIHPRLREAPNPPPYSFQPAKKYLASMVAARAQFHTEN